MLPRLLGAFPGTYLSAGIILLASLLVGRACLLVLGRRTATFLEGAVGISLLMAVESVAIRLPGHEKTSAGMRARLVVAVLLVLVVPPRPGFGPGVRVAVP